jgi:predicted nucleic-acid-binding protein
MTKEEKKEFFGEKREENKAEREAHRNVIDKLIDGEELNAEEKIILEEIKTIRVERATKKAEREALMEEIKPILTKVRA